MSVTQLLAEFANPEAMHSLSAADKLTAGLITTVLGMGITFVALVVLQFLISWMDKLLNTEKGTETPAIATVVKATESSGTDDTELIAVISSAIAMKLGTSTDRFIIKNVEKMADATPAWNRAGIIEQINNRL